MTENPSRRQVLQGVSSAGAVALFGASQASGASGPAVRLVEAGIYYDVPDSDDYVRYHVDSRPPYTVGPDRNQLLLLPQASDELVEKVRRGALVDEQSVTGGSPQALGGSDLRVETLPTALSTRMRITETIQLASKHRLPTVTVHWNANGVAATVQSRGRIDIEPNSRKRIELDPETVEVKTAEVTDEIVEVEGVPEHMWGPKREYGTTEIQATPVVEFVDYGTLSVTRKPASRED